MAGAPTQGQAEGLGVIVVPYYPTQGQAIMMEVMIGATPPVVPVQAQDVGLNVIVKTPKDIRATQVTLEVIGIGYQQVQARQVTLEVIGRPPYDVRSTQNTLEVIAAASIQPPTLEQDVTWWVIS